MTKKIGTFSGPLKATYIAERDAWHVDETFYFIRPNGDLITVPSGWETDLASTDCLPPILRAFFPSDGPYNQACVMHDYLYAGEFLPRGESDKIMTEGMEAIKGVPKWKIGPMWLGVRLGGWATYKQHSFVHIQFLRALIKEYGTSRPLWKDTKNKFKII